MNAALPSETFTFPSTLHDCVNDKLYNKYLFPYSNEESD